MWCGAIRALDLDDHPKEQYVAVVNRPNEETPIKNGEVAERQIALDSEACTILDVVSRTLSARCVRRQ